MMNVLIKTIKLSVLLLFFSAQSLADNPVDKVKTASVKVAENIYMITGDGGNIGILVGQDGVFMIDDQYAPLTDSIKAEILKISDKPITFLLNTHFHPDHTGGNENFGRSGAIIVAQDNVRKRLNKDQFIEFFQKKLPPANKTALPVVTFQEDMNFYLNGENIEVKHLHDAHTDGDSVVYFKNANVMHMGDIYFEKMYPFFDASNGGTARGMIAAMGEAITMMDDKTKVIAGHGELGNKLSLHKQQEMMKIVVDRIEKMIGQGKSLEEIVVAQPTKEFDKERKNGFLSPEKFIEIIYNDLKSSISSMQVGFNL